MRHKEIFTTLTAIKDAEVSELVTCLKRHNGHYEWQLKDAPVVCVQELEDVGTIYLEKIYLDEEDRISIEGTYTFSEFERDNFSIYDVYVEDILSLINKLS